MKKQFFILLISLFSAHFLIGQDVTISGSTNLNAPISINSSYNWSQFIYLNSDINQSGNITGITFQIKSPSGVDASKFNKWTVKVGHTSRNNFEYANFEYKKITGLTTVCTNTSITYTPSTGTARIDFSTPFAYNNSNNLVVEVLENVAGVGSYSNYDGCKGKSTGNDVRTIRQHKYSVIDPNSITGVGSYYTDKKVPNAIIHFQANTPYAVNTLTASQANAGNNINIGTTQVELLALNAQITGSQGTAKQMQNIIFDLNGTSNIADLSNLKLFYGTNSNLSSATEITGATLSAINASGTAFTNINQNLSAGNNYFFIVFDATNNTSSVGNTIDGNFITTTISSISHTPTAGTPTITGSTTGAITLALEPIEINPSGSGCGNSINSSLPAKYDDYLAKKSWSASVYNKNNFSGNSSISALAYFTDCKGSPCSYNPATNQKIYLGHINTSTFNNSNRPEDDNDITDLTLVHDGTVQWADGQWNNIAFNVTSFNYNQSKNLVIYWVNEHGGNLNSGFMCDNPSKIVDAFGGSGTLYSKYANTTNTTLPASGSTSNQAPIVKIHATPIATPLPIELLSFSAENQGINTTFTWQTATEINNDYFELQQSIDGENFSNIAKIKGAGNSNSLKNYTHNYSNNNCLYYRLKQTDFDGTFSYSKIIYHCGTSKDNTANSVKIYPNPLNEGNALQIDIEKPTPMLLVSIFNLQGQKVFQKQWKNNELQQHFSTSLTLEKGIYLLKINQDNYRKLVIK